MLCSEEKFLSIVKTIETIKFTKRRNLITSTQHIFSEDIDYFGLGRPDQFNVECDFKGIPITKKFKAALSRVRKKTQQQEFENIICVGKDGSQMETIFNLDTLRHKISIQAQADHNGMYDPNEVKELIQKRISNMNKNVPQT